MTFIKKKHPESISLQALLSSDARQVNQAIGHLYHNYYAGVAHYLTKKGMSDLDIQDIFQDGILVFLRALRSEKIKLKSNAGGYFFTICKHIALRHKDKIDRMPFADIDLSILESMREEELTAAEDEERSRLRKKCWEMLEEVGTPCQELLKRSLSGDEKIVDFFDELGYKNAQVARTAKYKCLNRLRAKLEKDPEASA